MDKYTLRPCPFCGSTKIGYWDMKDHGTVGCYDCKATLRFEAIEEHYELVSGDIYRKVPRKTGLDIAVEVWNRRANNGEF